MNRLGLESVRNFSAGLARFFNTASDSQPTRTAISAYGSYQSSLNQGLRIRVCLSFKLYESTC